MYHLHCYSHVCYLTYLSWYQAFSPTRLGSYPPSCHYNTYLPLCLLHIGWVYYYYAQLHLPLWICPLKCPVPFLICSQRYYSAIISVLEICLVLCVINLSIFVTLMMYDCPLWSVLLASAITPCIHGPPSSLCMTTEDPIGRESES